MRSGVVGMVAMMEALRHEHADMTALLDIIDAEFAGEAPPDYALVKEIVEYCLTYPDQYHHPKEDLIYRALCRHEAAAEPAIGDLEAEHEALAEITREFAAALADAHRRRDDGAAWLADLARGFVDRYRRHIEKEENDFFPEALRCFTPEEWADLEAQVTDPTDPLFREKAARRLAALRGRAST